MMWASVLASVLINTVIGQLLPPIETFMLVIHVLGFFAVLIPIVYVRLSPMSIPTGTLLVTFPAKQASQTHRLQMAPEKLPAHDVFTVFSNGGNWPTQGLSFFIGLIGSVYSMFGKLLTATAQVFNHRSSDKSLGCDSAVHVSGPENRRGGLRSNVPCSDHGRRWRRKSEMPTLQSLGL